MRVRAFSLVFAILLLVSLVPVALGSAVLEGLETPVAAVTGHSFTVHPVFNAGYTFPSTAQCTWEFRWGSSDALIYNTPDGTLGGLYFRGPASEYCVNWTFTLPWQVVRQYQVSLSYSEDGSAGGQGACIGCDGGGFIQATVDSTSRQITSSTIPIGYILPNKTSVTVGSSITYTRYLVGSTGVDDSQTDWIAHSTDSQFPSVRQQTGGTSFTFTPDRTGEWFAGWGYTHGSRWTQAYFDPKVKSSGTDTTAPTVTKPIQRLGSGQAGSAVGVGLSWTGSDSGSGVNHFTLQRSRDGGSWTTLTLASGLSTSSLQQLDPSHTYRFRVRATDDAGNQSAWAYDSTFTPKIVEESSTAISYVSSWTTVAKTSALGGALRQAGASTARASYSFSARDIAWVAERGPTRGIVDVYVDGSYFATVDLYASSTQSRRIVLTKHWSSLATHSISLRNRGTTGHPYADLDGFLVLK